MCFYKLCRNFLFEWERNIFHSKHLKQWNLWGSYGWTWIVARFSNTLSLPFSKTSVQMSFAKTALQKNCNENLMIFFVISVQKRMFCVYSKRKRWLTSRVHTNFFSKFLKKISSLDCEANLTRVFYKPVSYKKTCSNYAYNNCLWGHYQRRYFFSNVTGKRPTKSLKMSSLFLKMLQKL